MPSNRERRSSECRAPAAGRRSRSRLHFKQPAVCPNSSSIPGRRWLASALSLIHISEPTRLALI
eukprot:152902-Alexandrium_andersonii.AAC.1